MQTTDNKCPYCGRKLDERTVTLFGHEATVGYLPCDCPEAVKERRQEEERESAAKRELARRDLNRRFDRAHIPLEHRRYKHPEAKDLVESIKKHRGLYIVGKTGRRKTTLACGICCELIIQGFRGIEFVSAADIPSKIRSTYSHQSQVTEDELLHQYGNRTVLVLDDLGKGEVKDYSINMLFRILEYRAGALKPTIITSQFERDELGEWLDQAHLPELTASILSRLNGQFDRIHLDGPDYRLAGK